MTTLEPSTPKSSTRTPSHAAVLEALRHARTRQVMRYRHTPVFDALVELNFIVWVRQPVRLSQQVPDSCPCRSRSPS